MTDDLSVSRLGRQAAAEYAGGQMSDGHLRDLFERLATCDEADEPAIENLIFEAMFAACRRRGLPMSAPAPTFVGPGS